VALLKFVLGNARIYRVKKHFAKISMNLFLYFFVLSIRFVFFNKILFDSASEKGMKSSRHGPYKLGYTRVTMVATKGY